MKAEGCVVFFYWLLMGFPSGSVVKNLPANPGDSSLIPGSGRSPGEGNGNPLQYSCLGNSMDRGAWWATVHGFAKEWDMTEWLNTHMLFKVMISATWESYSVFLGLSYEKQIYMLFKLFTFLPLICLLLQGALSQKSRRVEGKLFSPLVQDTRRK